LRTKLTSSFVNVVKIYDAITDTDSLIPFWV